jgi:cytochrome c-type biogenesis protein CcmH/NrfG
MAIEGPLQELSIQDVLQLLDLAHKTGVLTIRSESLDDEAIVHFSKGAIVFAVRRRSTRRLGQLLIRSGKLTQRELDAALDLQRRDPTRRLAEILLEMGSISEEELERQLRFQMEETIYEVMAWDEGYFRFEERAEIASQRLLARVRVESLLMEGARRIDEWTRLESKVPGTDAVPSLAPGKEGESTVLELRPEEWEVLAEIDGERDLGQIAAHLGRSSFEVARTIYGLLTTGVVQVQERHGAITQPEVQRAVAEIDKLIKENKLEEAEKIATELERNHPENAELAVLAGRTFAAQGRMRAATEAFTRAVGLDPLLAEAHYLLGFSAVRTGELDRASTAWDTYLRLSPNGGHRQMVTQALTHVHSLTQLLETVKPK